MNKRVWFLLGLASLILMVAAGCVSTPSAGLTTPEPATQVAEAPPLAPTEAGGESASGLPVFYLVPAESEVRFLIDEVLAGAPTTVVGATNAFEGSFVPDFDTPSNTTVGTVRIDMSTLVTDNDFRNRAIHSAILETNNEAFRYTEFVTTALAGLPETVVVGEPFDFQITGNLTVHGVTKEVTFDATATAVSDTRLEGLASLKILYADYGVSILRMPPQVASVGDEVILEIEFVAAPQ